MQDQRAEGLPGRLTDLEMAVIGRLCSPERGKQIYAKSAAGVRQPASVHREHPSPPRPLPVHNPCSEESPDASFAYST
jgi:hypothetical protein